MKFNTYLGAIVGAAALAFLLFGTACSKDKGNDAPAVAGTCGAGYVYGGAQYGCLTQGNCSYGQAMINGVCQMVQTQNTCAVGSVNSQYGCIPQGSCSAGQGLYNGACVIATTPTYNNGNGQYGQYGNTGYYGGGYQTYPYGGYGGYSGYGSYPYYGGYSGYGYPNYGGGYGMGAGGYFHIGF